MVLMVSLWRTIFSSRWHLFIFLCLVCSTFFYLSSTPFYFFFVSVLSASVCAPTVWSVIIIMHDQRHHRVRAFVCSPGRRAALGRTVHWACSLSTGACERLVKNELAAHRDGVTLMRFEQKETSENFSKAKAFLGWKYMKRELIRVIVLQRRKKPLNESEEVFQEVVCFWKTELCAPTCSMFRKNSANSPCFTSKVGHKKNPVIAYLTWLCAVPLLVWL